MRTVLLMMSMIALSLAEPASAERFQKTAPADPRGTVQISNVAGRVEVRGWDRKEVSVDATYDSGVERIEFDSRRGRTVIRVIIPRHSWWANADARLRVRVPHTTELDVSAVSASIETSGIRGEQRLTSVSGDVRAEIGDADVEVKNVSGSVDLSGGSKNSDLRVSTVSGDVDLRRAAGDLEVSTISGRVDVELENVRDVRARTTSGRLELRGKFTEDGTVDAETVSGTFHLRLKMPKGFDYEVSSFSGRLSSCFDKEPERQRHGPRSRLAGVHGEGEGRVRVRTMNGSVYLCDH